MSKFGIARPRILVCGLNPHAGKAATWGARRSKSSSRRWRVCEEGIELIGPLPADTLFTPSTSNTAMQCWRCITIRACRCSSYKGFGAAVSTLGLPIVRTSVDHGTALDLAGTGRVDIGSLQVALETAYRMSGAA